MRFPMTLGVAAKVVTALVALLIVVLFVLPGREGAALMLPLLVTIVLGVTVLWAPRAVRLESDALVIERLAWFDLRIPFTDLVSVEHGPTLGVVGAGLLRVAGNGGLMGFTGFFWLPRVGLVRLWATQLGTTTVLIRRSAGRPIVLGVDDGAGLERALRHRLG